MMLPASCSPGASARRGRIKVVLYNPRAVFFTMPLALLAIGSEFDPELYEVVIVDGRDSRALEEAAAGRVPANATRIAGLKTCTTSTARPSSRFPSMTDGSRSSRTSSPPSAVPMPPSCGGPAPRWASTTPKSSRGSSD